MILARILPVSSGWCIVGPLRSWFIGWFLLVLFLWFVWLLEFSFLIQVQMSCGARITSIGEMKDYLNRVQHGEIQVKVDVTFVDLYEFRFLNLNFRFRLLLSFMEISLTRRNGQMHQKFILLMFVFIRFSIAIDFRSMPLIQLLQIQDFLSLNN